ncbi:MAG: aspartyl protease family protein [Parvularculaceae bacterium]
MRFLAFLFTVIAFMAPARATEPLADVPFRVSSDGNILVGVMVNGHGPYEFILDTGSTITLAFQNLSEIEHFEPTGGAPLRILAITGAEFYDAYHMGEISIGEARLPDHTGVLVEDWEAPRQTPAGVLGLDFLTKYTLAFDVGANRVKVYERGALPRRELSGYKKANLVAFHFANAADTLFTLRGSIRKRTVNFLIDIGSGSTMLNYKAASAVFAGTVRRTGAEGMTTGSRLKDVFDEKQALRTALIETMRVGPVAFDNAGVWVYDAPIFKELGVNRTSFGLFGADLILRQNFVLDFGNEAIYFAKGGRYKSRY